MSYIFKAKTHIKDLPAPAFPIRYGKRTDVKYCLVYSSCVIFSIIQIDIDCTHHTGCFHAYH